MIIHCKFRLIYLNQNFVYVQLSREDERFIFKEMFGWLYIYKLIYPMKRQILSPKKIKLNKKLYQNVRNTSIILMQGVSRLI